MSDETVIVRDFVEKDAPGLAQLFNESEEGWPGGLTGGVPYTAETVLDKIKSSDALAVLVAECDKKIVGYLELTKHWIGEDATYVALVNVHPKYRGRGIGTKLLKEAIKRSISLGVDRVDLHTWAGNEKAIRLYKKLGWFWVPETSVYMQNYLPQVLKTPIAKEFFAKHSNALYSFKRDLKAEEDEYEYQNRSVYVYEWRINGDFLKAIIDRYGWGLCGLEWNEGLIECLTEEDRVVKGAPFRVLYRIVNRSSKPFNVVLLPEAEKGVKVLKKPPSSITVKPGEEKVVEAEALVDIEAEEKSFDEPPLKLKTTAVLNGLPFNLFTGFDEKPPLAIKILEHPSYPPLSTGTIPVNLANNFKKKVKGRVTVVADKGVEVSPREYLFEASAEEEIALPLKVKLTDPSLKKTALFLSYEVEGIKSPPKTIYITIAKPGEAVGYIDRKEKRAVVDWGEYLLHVRLKGLSFSVIRKIDREGVCFTSGESIGPPFWPSELGRTLFDVDLIEENGSVKIVGKARLRKVPGLEFFKIIEVKGSSPLIKISYLLVNNSNVEKTVKLRIPMHSSSWQARKLVVPLKENILEATVIPGEFPGRKRDLPTKPDEFSENWSCYVYRGGEVVGAIWSRENLDEVDFSWGSLPRLIYVVKLKPYSRVELPPVYIYVGKGSWKDIRNYYKRNFEKKAPETEVAYSKVDVVEIRSLPEPVLLETRSTEIELSLVKHREKKLKGRIELTSPKVRVEPAKIELGELNEKEFGKKIRIEVPELTPRCYTISCLLYSNYGLFKKEIPVVVVGREGEVVVTIQGNKATVDNELLVMKIDGDFAGTLYELVDKETGASHLMSSYPEPKPLDWINPWYGGIRLKDRWGRDNLFREKWTVEEAAIGSWRGVKVWTKVSYEKNRRLKGVTLEQYYLTKPYSNIILSITKVVNSTRRYIEPELFLSIFPKPGGENAKGALVPYNGEEYVKEVYEYESSWPVTLSDYAVIYSSKGALALIKPQRNDIALAVSIGFAKTCTLDAIMFPLKCIEPGETRIYHAFLVVAKTLSDARAYKALSKVKYTMLT